MQNMNDKSGNGGVGLFMLAYAIIFIVASASAGFVGLMIYAIINVIT